MTWVEKKIKEVDERKKQQKERIIKESGKEYYDKLNKDSKNITEGIMKIMEKDS